MKTSTLVLLCATAIGAIAYHPLAASADVEFSTGSLSIRIGEPVQQNSVYIERNSSEWRRREEIRRQEEQRLAERRQEERRLAERRQEERRLAERRQEERRLAERSNGYNPYNRQQANNHQNNSYSHNSQNISSNTYRRDR